MNNIDIEKFSIIAVDYSMYGCLRPVLQKNDKLPSWDGEIQIYKDSLQKKGDMIGRIPVQVKGTANDDFSQSEIRRSVCVSDLKNYYNDGGALYFVIYVRENRNTKIYYNALTPDVLHQILKETQEQQTEKTLTFKEFPEKVDEILILLKKINSECENLLPALEKAKENAGLIRGIDNIKKKAKFQNKKIKLRDFKNVYNTIRQNPDTVISSKEEFDVYNKLPKIWRNFGQIYGVARWSFVGFLIGFYFLYRTQILENIPLVIGSVFAIYLYAAICATYLKTVFKESAKFSDCLGYSVAQWMILPIIFSFIFLFKRLNIVSFDIFNIPITYHLYGTIIFAVIRIISVSLYRCAQGKFSKLCSSDTRNNLIVESILHKIPENYWTDTDIQKLINITTENKLEFLSDTLEVFESTKANDTEVHSDMEFINDENTQSNDKKTEYYQQTTDLKSTFADAYFNMGVSYLSKGNFDKALKNFKKALKRKPDNSDTYVCIGDAYRSKGNYDDAIENYKKAIELNPDNTAAYNNMGIAYDEKGNLDEAIKCYEKVIKLDSNDAAAYNNMGFVYYVKSNSDRAIEYYKKAIELFPNYADAYNNMGVAYCAKGHFDKAIKNYEKAIELNPNAMTYNNLGVAYDEIGKHNEAIRCYEKASMLEK